MSGGAVIAAAAAAAEQARRNEEEEQMTAYSREELEQDWEFKIIRSNFNSFKKTWVLKKLCEDEARAGWIMVEKFDNGRVRFKRSADAKKNDKLLSPDIDPYRTQYGMSNEAFVLFIISVCLGALVLIIGVVALLKQF
jgi:hypothetical protein